MLFIWLIVWLCHGLPLFDPWSNWTIGIIVCGVMDLSHALYKVARR